MAVIDWCSSNVKVAAITTPTTFSLYEPMNMPEKECWEVAIDPLWKISFLDFGRHCSSFVPWSQSFFDVRAMDESPIRNLSSATHIVDSLCLFLRFIVGWNDLSFKSADIGSYTAIGPSGRPSRSPLKSSSSDKWSEERWRHWSHQRHINTFPNNGSKKRFFFLFLHPQRGKADLIITHQCFTAADCSRPLLSARSHTEVSVRAVDVAYSPFSHQISDRWIRNVIVDFIPSPGQTAATRPK